MRASTSASAPECALAELVGSLGPNAKKWRGRNGEDSGATKDNDDLVHARARGEPDSATPKGGIFELFLRHARALASRN